MVAFILCIDHHYTVVIFWPTDMGISFLNDTTT